MGCDSSNHEDILIQTQRAYFSYYFFPKGVEKKKTPIDPFNQLGQIRSIVKVASSLHYFEMNAREETLSFQ